MALVSSSLSSQSFRKVQTLPRIEHPSKLIDRNDQSQLDIRGKSRDGLGNGQLIRSETSTPDSMFSRRSTARRRSSSFKQFSSSQPLTTIDENKNDVRLPIFGKGHRPTSTMSTTNDNKQLELDQLENIFKEKLRYEMHDIRAKFRHAQDYDSNGRISQQALHHIIASTFGTQIQISPQQIDLLLQRFHLNHLPKVTFDQLLSNVLMDQPSSSSYALSRQSSSSSLPSSPVQTNQSLVYKNASQLFFILKEKYRTKDADLIAICPSLNGGEPKKMFKNQFHNDLIDMGFKINDREFDKLWDKFDPDGFHVIDEDRFVKRLQSEDHSEKLSKSLTSETQDQQAAILRSSFVKSSSQSNRIHTARNQLDEEQIRNWLNYKFPQGFSQLEQSLENVDEDQTGFICEEDFLDELKSFGVILEKHLFEFFLKRLNIDLSSTNKMIPYQKLILLFQQIIYQNTTHKANSQTDESRQSALEKQIESLIEKNFDEVLSKMKRLDRSNVGTIELNEMRSIIEDLLEFTLRPDEFFHLAKSFPQDQYRHIFYHKYLDKIRRKSKTISNDKQRHKSALIPQWDYMRSSNIKESLNQQLHSSKNKQKLSTIEQNHQPTTRTIQQLRQILEDLIRNRYKDIEEQFQKLDRNSYGELNEDLLFKLFQSLNVRPSINNNEIMLILSNCHLKENGKLDFYQFLREFGYKKQDAHFPNAKQNPPKKGDSDFLLTSRKLYGDSVLVHGTALNAIRSNWDDLKSEFVLLDPYRTGFIQPEEFDDILQELCPAVNQQDLDMFRHKFQTKHDSRINYVRFLRVHVPYADLIDEIDESPTTNNSNPIAVPSTDLLTKIKSTLLDRKKQLRRAFKQRDQTNSGFVSISTFRQLLNEFNCVLNDELFYRLISQLDTKIDGNINYTYFIQHFIN